MDVSLFLFLTVSVLKSDVDYFLLINDWHMRLAVTVTSLA